MEKHPALLPSVSCRNTVAVYRRVPSQEYKLRMTIRESNPYTDLGAEAPRISRHLAHEGGKVVSPAHRPSLPNRRYPGTNFC
jgi:hypothetical protein